jgi:hypothetical protein
MTAKRRVGLIICSMIAALCLSRTSVAGPTECQEAITDYKVGPIGYLDRIAIVCKLRCEQRWT